jgi:hypothetical protein
MNDNTGDIRTHTGTAKRHDAYRFPLSGTYLAVYSADAARPRGNLC